MGYHNDLTIERKRLAALRDAIAGIRRPIQSATPRRLVQVYTDSSLPTCTPCYYVGRPVEMDGGECEGCSGTPTADTSNSIPFVLLQGSASIGDILTVHQVGGRWVAEKGGSCACQTFTVKCAGSAVSGSTVTIKNGSTVVATGTTNSSGVVSLCVPAGTYTVTATGGTCSPGYSGTLSLVCGGSYTLSCCTYCATCPIDEGSTINLTVVMGAGRACSTGTASLTFGGCGPATFAGPFICGCSPPLCGFAVLGCVTSGPNAGIALSICDSCACSAGCTYFRSQASSYSCSPISIVWHDGGVLCSSAYQTITLTGP